LTVSGYRVAAVLLGLLGIVIAAYVEYGSPRAAEVERSFAWFAFEAGPYVLLTVLALFAPFWRALALAGLAMLALEAYAYYIVFVLPLTDDAPLVYLHKPLYDLGIIAIAMLAGFLVSRQRAALR
jgi:hypothetical protein